MFEVNSNSTEIVDSKQLIATSYRVKRISHKRLMHNTFTLFSIWTAITWNWQSCQHSTLSATQEKRKKFEKEEKERIKEWFKSYQLAQIKKYGFFTFFLFFQLKCPILAEIVIDELQWENAHEQRVEIWSFVPLVAVCVFSGLSYKKTIHIALTPNRRDTLEVNKWISKHTIINRL